MGTASPSAASLMGARSTALLVMVAVLSLSLRARAGRPPEALEAERRAEEVALQYLIRKTDSLSSQLVERRGHLRKRLRAMYKMSQGGYLRLLLGAESAADLFARRDAADRILLRDVGELEAVRTELYELRGLREALREGERRTAALGAVAQRATPTGMARHDAIHRPVDGALVRDFGPYLDATSGVELSGDGVRLRSRVGEPVRAPAAGSVRSVGEVPGLGICVILDHGEGWLTLVGGLANPTVRIGARVPADFVIGEAAGSEVELQVSQGGAWLDPAPWLGAHLHHQASPGPR